MDTRFTGAVLKANSPHAGEVYNLLGDVHVQPSDGGRVEAEGFLHGADRKQILLVNFGRGMGVHYPGSRIVTADRTSLAETTVNDHGVFPAADGRAITLAPAGTGLDAVVHLRVSLPRDRTVIVNLFSGTLSLATGAELFAATDAVRRIEVENRGGDLHARELDGTGTPGE